MGCKISAVFLLHEGAQEITALSGCTVKSDIVEIIESPINRGITVDDQLLFICIPDNSNLLFSLLPNILKSVYHKFIQLHVGTLPAIYKARRNKKEKTK
jgi:hypothetical protein